MQEILPNTNANENEKKKKKPPTIECDRMFELRANKKRENETK